VQQWNACAQWAASFQDRRVFIAGDAAHNMPPTGCFGGNTGVQDGHNLAWKLAYVLNGTAGPDLLSTYGAERLPVGRFTTEQAYTRCVLRLAPELGKENLEPIVPEHTVELGYRYRSTAVLPDDADDDAVFENPFEPSAQPGTRLPHVELERDGETVSTHDLLQGGFLVLAGPDGAAWSKAATAAAGSLGVAIDSYTVGDGGDLGDSSGRFAEVFRTGAGGAVLVRPGGFIAWRTDVGADDPDGAMTGAVSRVLAR
jgi:FAD binding domain/Aromatic-ring hydroxylase, C-terminal